MSIVNQIASIKNHIEDAYDWIETAGTNLINVDKNILNINNTLTERLQYYLAHDLNIVWDNWEKVIATGTNLTLNNTVQAPMKIELKGNISQNTKILPDGYTQVDYIESTGTQYIDTGVKPCMNKIRCVCDMMPMNASDSAFFGTRGTYYLFYNVSGNYFWPISKCETIQGTLEVGKKYHIDWNKGTLEVTGENGVYEKGIRSNDTQDDLDMYLFNFNPRDGRQSLSRIYYFKIYVEDVLVRNMIPCYRNSDNEVGLYDLVNNVFYTNQGTGTFTYGAVVGIPNPDYPQDIQIVSGNNEIKIEGKNLLDFSLLRQGGSTGIGANRLFVDSNLRLEVGSTYTVSTNLDTSVYRYALVGTRQTTPNSSGFIYDSTWKTTSTFTLTVATIAYYNINISRIDNGNLVPSDISSFWFMLEKSSTATDYEPYQSQSYPINLPVENLLDSSTNVDGYYINENGIITASSSGFNYTALIPIQQGIYTWSGIQYKTTSNNKRIHGYNNNGEWIEQVDWFSFSGTTSGAFYSKAFTINNPNIKYIRLSYYNDDVEVQLEKGSKANSYSEYGITPIELCKIGTYQDRIFKSTGKNLFNKDNEQLIVINPTTGTERYGFIVDAQNKKVSISTTSWGINSLTYKLITNGEYSDYIQINQNSTINVPEKILFYIGTENTKISDIFPNFQVEINDQPTSYEPYGTKWCVEKNIGEVVLDGSEGTWESWYNTGNSNIGFYNYLGAVIAKENNETQLNGNAYSNMFSEAPTRLEIVNGLVEKFKICGGTGYSYLAIGLSKDKLTDWSSKTNAINSCKSWLVNNNPIVYYKLTTPTYTEITDTTLINELESLELLKSYDEQTNITQNSNNLNFELTATALKNI